MNLPPEERTPLQSFEDWLNDCPSGLPEELTAWRARWLANSDTFTYRRKCSPRPFGSWLRYSHHAEFKRMEAKYRVLAQERMEARELRNEKLRDVHCRWVNAPRGEG